MAEPSLAGTRQCKAVRDIAMALTDTGGRKESSEGELKYWDH